MGTRHGGRSTARAHPLVLLAAVVALLGILLLTLSANQPPAQASTQVLFGPQQYTLTTPAPQTTSTLVSTTAGPAHLHVLNGAADGSARLTHASITLNGLEIVSPHDLGAHMAMVDKPATLLSNNLLTVTLSGPVNGTLTLTLEQRSAALTSVTPASGRQGESLTVTVGGTGAQFTQGSTLLWAGTGISVGGVPPGAFGPVTVQDATHLTAALTIAGSSRFMAPTSGKY